MKSIAMFVLVLLLVAGGSCSASAQEVKNRQDVLAELAAIELRVTVDRDFAGADAALTALEAQCANAGLADVLTDPVVEATRVRIRSSLEAARRDDSADLQKSVADAIATNDEITLSTLGTRAARVLRNSFEGSAGPLTEVTVQQRLMWLMRLDDESALELLAKDPARVASPAVVIAELMNNGLTWEAHEGRRPVLRRPEWLDCLANLLESEAARETLINFKRSSSYLIALVGVLSDHDAFTPRLTDDIGALIAAMDGYSAVQTLAELQGVWVMSAQPLLERFVTDERVAVRTAAAKQLWMAEQSDGLRSRVGDSDVGMRLLVVQSLGERTRQIQSWQGRNPTASNQWEELAAAEDPQARELVSRLASDPDPSVRDGVISILRKLKAPLGAEVYRRLVADPDPLVRAAMAAVDHPEPELQAELHVALASDAERRVVDALDQRLAAGNWKAESEWMLPVFRARLANETVPIEESTRLPGAVSYWPAARQECTAHALRTGRLGALSLLTTRGRGGSGAASEAYEDWVAMDGDDMARLLPMLHELNPAIVVDLAYRATRVRVQDSVPDAVEPLARRPELPPGFRIAALSLALHKPTEARRQLLVELLSDPRFGPDSPNPNDGSSLVSIPIQSVPVEERNAVILEVLTKLTLHERLAVGAAQLYERDAPDAVSVTRLILDRWASDRSNAYALVDQAAFQLGRMPEVVDEPLLRRLLLTGHNDTAIFAMARLRDPRYLGLLRDCLDPTWADQKSDIAKSAVDALQGYMSDEAATILLEAAANSPYASVREKALAAVEAIGRYRDALAAWKKRKTVEGTRDEAVGRLVALCTDASRPKEVRAEALRALGTLGAVECLPIVIEALGSDDTDVRQAAREALQKLNAPPPAPDQPKSP